MLVRTLHSYPRLVHHVAQDLQEIGQQGLTSQLLSLQDTVVLTFKRDYHDQEIKTKFLTRDIIVTWLDILNYNFYHVTSKSTILNYNFQHDIKIRHFELIFNKGHQNSPFLIQFLTCDIRIHHFKLYFQQVTSRYAILNYNFLHVSSSSAILIYFFPLNIISLYNKIRHFEFLFLPRSTLNF